MTGPVGPPMISTRYQAGVGLGAHAAVLSSTSQLPAVVSMGLKTTVSAVSKLEFVARCTT